MQNQPPAQSAPSQNLEHPFEAVLPSTLPPPARNPPATAGITPVSRVFALSSVKRVRTPPTAHCADETPLDMRRRPSSTRSKSIATRPPAKSSCHGKWELRPPHIVDNVATLSVIERRAPARSATRGGAHRRERGARPNASRARTQRPLRRFQDVLEQQLLGWVRLCRTSPGNRCSIRRNCQTALLRAGRRGTPRTPPLRERRPPPARWC